MKSITSFKSRLLSLAHVFVLLVFSSWCYAEKLTVTVGNVLISDNISKQAAEAIDLDRIQLDLEQAILSIHQFELIDRRSNTNQMVRKAYLTSLKVNTLNLPVEAEFIITPIITEFVFLRQYKNIANIMNKFRYTDKGSLAISIEISNIESGQILTSIPLLTRFALKPQIVSEKTPGPPRSEFNAMSVAAMSQLGPPLINVMFPMEVLEVRGKVFWINRGVGSGLKTGQVLHVYYVGKNLTDPHSLKSLGQAEMFLGKAEVMRINPKLTTMKWLGDVEFVPAVGDIVRVP